jgi:hypothetical protein
MMAKTQKTAFGRVLALILGGLVTVMLADIMLRILTPNWIEFDSRRFMRLITTPNGTSVTTGKPNFDGYFAQNNGDFRVRIRINAFGLRNAAAVGESGGRIWIVGDSMAFGWGVESGDMYSSVIGRAIGLPTYNVASPGTNVCGYQALLARMPAGVKPRAVVLGLVLENDVIDISCGKNVAAREAPGRTDARSENKRNWIRLKDVKAWLTVNSALYNFFAVSLKRIDIVRKFLTTIGVINPVNTYRRPGRGGDMENAVNSTAREIEIFKSMLSDTIPFVVLIAPGRFELKDGNAVYARLRLAMNKALKDRGIDAVDPFERFLAAGYEPVHFLHDGHWSLLGHKIAGEETARYLKRLIAE